IFGWDALKSATTLSSTVFCSGASPPPRQQYQRISTGPPGGTVGGPDGDGATDADSEGWLLGAAGLCEAVVPPQALASRANAVNRTPGRDRRWCMAPPPVLAPRLPSAAGDRARRARRWRGSRRATGSPGR